MPPANTALELLKRLRAKWVAFLLMGLVVIVAVAWSTRQETISTLWLFLAAFAFLYQALIFYFDLNKNHSVNSKKLHPHYGPGTWLSLLRLLALSLLAGFLALPQPAGKLAWAPFVLYLIFNLVDLVDGYFARRGRRVTRLGEKLDLDLDGRGMLLGSLLAVLIGKAGWWYLLVGLARYLWVFALWLRQRQGLPIGEQPNPNSRPLAGLQMGITTALLAPVLFPPFTILISTLVMIPFLGNFIVDWQQIVKKVNKDTSRHDRLAEILVPTKKYLPLIVRILLTALIAKRLFVGEVLGDSIFVEAAVGLGIFLGVGVRILGLLLLIYLGLALGNRSPVAIEFVLSLCNLVLVYLGAGSFALWEPENAIIRRRLGD